MKPLWTNILSRLFGALANHAFPAWLQTAINRLYVRLTGVDLSACAHVSSYPTLNALFTRALRLPRPICSDAQALVSPADSLISACGIIEGYVLFQIKGSPYGLHALLGAGVEGKETMARMAGGSYVTFYLSPKDYHRYHAPCAMRVHEAYHLPGALWPVNFFMLGRLAELYSQNERVVLRCSDTLGRLFYLVFVGALNVGSMRFHFDPTLLTNQKTLQSPHRTRYADVQLQKGEEIGYFQMGSTIVGVFEKGMVQLETTLMQSVRMGERVGTLLP